MPTCVIRLIANFMSDCAVNEHAYVSAGSTTFDEAVALHRNDLEKLREINRITSDHALLLGLSPHSSSLMINTSLIDLSLWYTLIRNISALKSARWRSLEKKILKPNHTEPVHDVIRLRQFRNYLVHMSFSKLDNLEFDRIWKELSSALRRRGISQEDIDVYMNQQSFDPAQVMSNFIALQQQVQRDFQAQYEAERQKNKRTFVTMAVLYALLVIALVGAAVGTCWWVYTKSRTWASCINDMEFVRSSTSKGLRSAA